MGRKGEEGQDQERRVKEEEDMCVDLVGAALVETQNWLVTVRGFSPNSCWCPFFCRCIP